MGAAPAEFFGAGSDQIQLYVDLLLSRGIDWGLMGPREGERIWERHVLNCAALAPLIPQDSTVVDIGSGAGLPGIPLAVLRPDLQVTLVESMARRTAFLDLAVAELELSSRVEVVRSRAEEHAGRYDVVTSRAVAALPRLLAWCAPLMKPQGRVLALKGSSVHEELAQAASDLRRLKLKATVHDLSVPVCGEQSWALEAWRA